MRGMGPGLQKSAEPSDRDDTKQYTAAVSFVLENHDNLQLITLYNSGVESNCRKFSKQPREQRLRSMSQFFFVR